MELLFCGGRRVDIRRHLLEFAVNIRAGIIQRLIYLADFPIVVDGDGVFNSAFMLFYDIGVQISI